jgi:hypothetical protein
MKSCPATTDETLRIPAFLRRHGNGDDVRGLIERDAGNRLALTEQGGLIAKQVDLQYPPARRRRRQRLGKNPTTRAWLRRRLRLTFRNAHVRHRARKCTMRDNNTPLKALITAVIIVASTGGEVLAAAHHNRVPRPANVEPLNRPTNHCRKGINHIQIRTAYLTSPSSTSRHSDKSNIGVSPQHQQIDRAARCPKIARERHRRLDFQARGLWASRFPSNF